MLVGRVKELWRFPVKSMTGERMLHVLVQAQRVLGDRMIGVFDSDGRVLTAGKSAPELLHCVAKWAGDPLDEDSVVFVTVPDGRHLSFDDPRLADYLSEVLDQRVALQRASPEVIYRKISGKPMPQGTLVDQSPLHLPTTASLRQLRQMSNSSACELARFRCNVLIESQDGECGFIEDMWVGQVLKLGEVILAVKTQTGRCVVTTRSQPGLLEDKTLLQSIKQANQNFLGVRAEVIRPGLVGEGDAVELLGSLGGIL